MKKILLATMVLACVFTACKKVEDLPEVRLFRPVVKTPLFSDGNWIEASWQKIGNAKNYTVELSRDTFKTVLVSQTVDTNFYRFENLEWNRNYQVQVKANAMDSQFDSKFSLLGTIKTPTFPSILNQVGVSDVTDAAVRISWTNSGAPVTEIKILRTSDSAVIRQVALTATDISNGFRIVGGLTGSTGYTAFLYSGTTVRGWTDFTTRTPYTGSIIDLREITGRPSVLADTIPVIPSGSTVLLKRGEQYNVSSTINLNKSIVITSGADLTVSEPARLFFTSNFNLTAGSVIDSIEFNDVYMWSNSYSSRYIFNTTGSAQVGKLKFVNLHAEIFRGLVRLQSGTTTVNEFIVDNCILDSLAGYGVITVDNVSCRAENISITNSTIYKAEKVITSRQNSTSVLVENVTFNEAPLGNSSNYYIDYNTGSSNTVTNGITVNNCIFGIGKNSAGNFTVRDVRTNSATPVNTSNNYRTADHVSAGNDFPGIITYTRPSTELWQDPINGNFKIVDNLFPGRSNSGDPRWRL